MSNNYEILGATISHETQKTVTSWLSRYGQYLALGGAILGFGMFIVYGLAYGPEGRPTEFPGESHDHYMKRYDKWRLAKSAKIDKELAPYIERKRAMEAAGTWDAWLESRGYSRGSRKTS